MKTLYLHIGLPKTGTTALQHFLDDNRDVLHKHGICYPDLGFRYEGKGELRNAHFLMTDWEWETEESGMSNPGPDYERGLDLAAEAAAEFQTIILSDEALWRAGSNRIDFWQKLKRDMISRGLDPKPVVYLRRQDLWVQSFWQQKIKTGSLKAFSDYLKVMEEKHYPTNFYEYLSHLISVFGKDSVIIRVYEKGQFLGEEHTLFSDFLDILGLRMSDGFEIQQHSYNMSIHGGYLEIRRHLNISGDFAYARSILKTATKKLIRLEEARDPDLYKRSWFSSPEAQAAYIGKFSESNSRVARELLGREDGILFREPFCPLPPYDTGTDQLLIDTIRLYGEAIRMLDRKNRKLEAELEELKKNTVPNKIVRKIRGIRKEK